MFNTKLFVLKNEMYTFLWPLLYQSLISKNVQYNKNKSWLLIAHYSLVKSHFFSFIDFFILRTNFSWPRKMKVQGISRPPCAKSEEYLLLPVTTQVMSPPCSINILHSLEIFRGTCPTVSPESALVTATAYLSTTLCSSFSVHSISPKTAVQVLL